MYLCHWVKGHTCTWSVQELALSHVGDVQPLEQQNQVTEVLLCHSWTVGQLHPRVVQRLRVETETQA